MKTDQEKVDELGLMLERGQWDEAHARAVELAETCDRTGVLMEWLSVRQLFESIAQVTRDAAARAAEVAPGDVTEGKG